LEIPKKHDEENYRKIPEISRLVKIKKKKKNTLKIKQKNFHQIFPSILIEIKTVFKRKVTENLNRNIIKYAHLLEA
jgi:hypothetical protein